MARKTPLLCYGEKPYEHRYTPACISAKNRDMNISAAELARRLHVPTNRITQIIDGTRDITADTALRLARFFGTSSEFWMNLQSLHDLDQAQHDMGQALKTIKPCRDTASARA
jgi:antitoxin HigA-1